MEEELKKYKIVEEVTFGGKSIYSVHKKNISGEWVDLVMHGLDIRVCFDLKDAKAQARKMASDTVAEKKEHYF